MGSPDRKRTHETVEPGRRVGAEDEEGGVGLHVDPGAAADGIEPPHRDAALVAEAEPYSIAFASAGELATPR